ncbi:MAG: DUF5615 family PIN-like protein [Coleofasciculus sp. G3-WIS-01]|uniref:DUF5615 family PIN-like protein n=1 Tax=Coleofasciculus sp. G3-WIS-01 TaxID=3069528 RepID=UPI0032F87119
MRFKLDENVDVRVAIILRQVGHDVATVSGQGLNSTSDVELITICHSEGRCLVTCDRGFGNRLRYKPSDYSGIVVLRLPSRPTFADWREVANTLVIGLESAEVQGKLWIVQGGRILEYQSVDEEEVD